MKKFILVFACSMTLVSALAVAAVVNLDVDRLVGEIRVYVDDRPARQGSGKLATVERKLDGFDRISLHSAENLEVRIGPKTEVKLIGDDNLLELVETRVVGGELIVEARGSYRTKTAIQVQVQLPRLKHFALEGSADARISGLSGERFSVELDGSGTVEASGRVEKLDAELNGSGDLRLASLQAESVEAELNGSGDIEVAAVDSLKAELNGSGDIRYRGSPKQLRSEINGSGDIERAD